ncbi:MAG: DUF6134 family protein [Micavibrio sp.]|nr:DUF6134 family protein [Micavibrio sp.]
MKKQLIRMGALLFGAAAVLLMPVHSFAAEKKLEFAVIRKGGEIGSHVITINTKGDKTTVDIQTRIAVKVLFVTAYSYAFDGTEVWQDGKLISLSTKSNDNGDKHVVSAERKDGKLMLTTDGATDEIADDSLPSSWWNKATMKKKELLDVIKGTIDDVTIEPGEPEEIDIGGKSVKADTYVVTGGLNRQLWYAKDGSLLKQSFTKKGEFIQYIRR